MKISEDAFTGCVKVRICSTYNSFAHLFAKKHHLQFKVVGPFQKWKDQSLEKLKEMLSETIKMQNKKE